MGLTPPGVVVECQHDSLPASQRGSQGIRITDLTNRIRQIRECKLWKKSCLQRDKVCQGCYSTNHLEVDHIEPLTALLKLHKIASVEAAKACQELWDITNGLTLCHSCHRKKHFKS